MNRKVYYEGIRQLKKMAIFCGFLLCAGCLAAAYFIYERSNPAFLDLSKIFVQMRLFVAVCSAVLTGYLFRFLHSENGCDFYFQIRCSRKVLTISYIVAIWTWMAGIILAVLGIFGSVGFLIFQSGREIVAHDFLVLGQEIFLEFCICVYVTASVLLAMSLTGNWIAAAAVFLMETVMLRAVLFFFYVGMVANIQYLVQEDWIGGAVSKVPTSVFDYHWNLLCDAMACSMQTESVEPVRYWRCGFYTLAIGMIWLAAGVRTISRRSFEAAQGLTLYPWLQKLLRFIPGLLLSLFTTTWIFCAKSDWTSWPDGFKRKYWFYLMAGIGLYAVAALAIYLYEGLTTGKWRCLKRVMPQILLLIPLNVLFLLGMLGGRLAIGGYCPSANQIKSVKIAYRGEIADRLYFADRVSQMDIKDKAVKQAVSDCLKSTIERCRVQAERISGACYEVRINTFFGHIDRLLYLGEDEEAYFVDSLEEAGVWDMLRQEFAEETTIFSNEVSVLAQEWAGSQDLENFKEAYMRDMQEMRFSDVYGKTAFDSIEGTDTYITVAHDQKLYLASLLPSCSNSYAEYVNSYNKRTDEEPLQEVLKRGRDGENIVISITAIPFENYWEYTDSLFFSNIEPELSYSDDVWDAMEAFGEKIRKKTVTPEDLDYGLLRIEAIQINDDTENDSFYGAYPLTKELLKEFYDVRNLITREQLDQ